MRRNTLQIYVIIGLLVLSYYSLQNPIFRETKLAEHEGKIEPFYYVKILEAGDSYLAKLGFSDTKITIITDAELKEGDVVSFYGLVKGGRLYAEKYHIHGHPNSPYYLSIVGLLLLLFILSRRET